MYEWTVKIKIDPMLVKDGLNLTERRLYTMLMRALPYAPGHLMAVEVVKAPSDDELAKEMGYESGSDPVWLKRHGGER